MMLFRGVQLYCPDRSLPVRPRAGPPVPPEQRPLRRGELLIVRPADSCRPRVAPAAVRRFCETLRNTATRLA